MPVASPCHFACYLSQLCSRGTATGDQPSTSKKPKHAAPTSQSPGFAALAHFVRASPTPAPPAPLAKQLNKADATRATAALTLPNETFQRVLDALAEFEVERRHMFASIHKLSASASFFLYVNPKSNHARFAMPEQVTESPSESPFPLVAPPPPRRPARPPVALRVRPVLKRARCSFGWTILSWSRQK